MSVDLQTLKGEFSFNVEVKRATGEVEQYTLVGKVLPEDPTVVDDQQPNKEE